MRFYRIKNNDLPKRNIKIADLDWYAVRTPPLKEFVAEQILWSRGYAVICPVLGKKMRASRYAKRKRRDIEVPLLSSYVLIGFRGEPDWHELFSFGRRQGLVTAVCGFNGKAQVIPESSMKWIARMSQTTNVNVIDAKNYGLGAGNFRRGDRADVISGPLSGHTVRIDELNGQSASCLIKLFGGKQSATISVDNLQLVD